MVLPFLAALAPFAPLIGGAVSAIGGMVSGGNKPQTQTNYVDYKRMVKDAQAAGFNPLTALRNGGSAGFGVSQMPAMGGSPFGNALQTFGSAIANTDFSGQAQHRERLEIALMEKQLAAANTDIRGIAGLGSFNVPTAKASTVKTNGLAGDVTGNPTVREEGKVEVTNPWKYWLVDPERSNAGAFEDAYGDDIGGWLGSVYAMGHDYKYNLDNTSSDVKRGLLPTVMPFAPFLGPASRQNGALGNKTWLDLLPKPTTEAPEWFRREQTTLRQNYMTGGRF